MQVKKLILNSAMNDRTEKYEPHEIIIEKTVNLSHEEFETLRTHPEWEHRQVRLYRDLMYTNQKNDTVHGVLFIDEENGDGILVNSELEDYVLKSQFIPDARMLAEAHGLTPAEWKLHAYLKKMVSRIAEMAHDRVHDFRFSEIADGIGFDFQTILHEITSEMLREREDIQKVTYYPAGVPWAELTVHTVPAQEYKLYSPLRIVRGTEEIPSVQAVGYAEQINEFIRNLLSLEEKVRGLMADYAPDSPVSEKVISAFPSVEAKYGTLLGVLTCRIAGELTGEQSIEFCDWWEMQEHEKFGIKLKQYGISTEIGEIHVDFDKTDSWYIQTADELENALAHPDENPEMSDMSLT